MHHHLQPACRACGAVGLTPILPAATKPAADRLLGAERPYARRFKHTVGLALCPSCKLVQMVEVRPTAERMHDAHVYHLQGSLHDDRMLSDQVTKACRLTRRTLVIEVASGDGRLLSCYKDLDIPVLGIEAVSAAALTAQRRGLPTLCNRFGLDLARRIAQCGQSAAVLHVRGMLNYVADLQHFVESMSTILAPDGVAILDVSYIRDEVESSQHDTRCAYYLSHFSLASLARLLGSHGLGLCDVERLEKLNVLRVWARRNSVPSDAVPRLLEDEQRWGVDRLATYQRWAQRLERLRGASIPLPGFAPPASHTPTLGSAV